MIIIDTTPGWLVPIVRCGPVHYSPCWWRTDAMTALEGGIGYWVVITRLPIAALPIHIPCLNWLAPLGGACCCYITTPTPLTQPLVVTADSFR